MNKQRDRRTGWQKVQDNPSLHPDALTDEEGEKIRWHSPLVPHSSQVVCVSAFGTLRNTNVVESVLSKLFSSFKFGFEGTWKIELEKERQELLNEYGGGRSQSTSIDAFFTCSNAVICLEAKFKRDAVGGFGVCSQAQNTNEQRKSCAGYYGPGSDVKTKTRSWCRLEVWDGERSPRLYWSLGRAFFQPDVFAKQGSGEDCHFKGHNYQLMRNFLFAAAYAQRNKLATFGVMTILPKKFAKTLEKQLDEFRNKVLLPQYGDCVCSTSYEAYTDLLQECEDRTAKELAEFLRHKCLPLVNKTVSHSQVIAQHDRTTICQK